MSSVGIQICPVLDCLEQSSRDLVHPDCFIRKEVQALTVYCPNRVRGCYWEDKLSKYKYHLDNVCTHGLEDFGRIAQIKGDSIGYRPATNISPAINISPTNSSTNSNEVDASDTERVMNKVKIIMEGFQESSKKMDRDLEAVKVNYTTLAKLVQSTVENVEKEVWRIALLDNASFDGTLVWKINNFSRRMTDAQSGNYSSLFSMPFYTRRHGYKLCLRLYILGDGCGKNTHMSLFFVIMKGEFDNILKWPFTCKVTLKLINQKDTADDVIDTFRPDSDSTSFKKPTTEFNRATGCPRFVPHTKMRESGYIMDDCIFIKVFG